MLAGGVDDAHGRERELFMDINLKTAIDRSAAKPHRRSTRAMLNGRTRSFKCARSRDRTTRARQVNYWADELHSFKACHTNRVPISAPRSTDAGAG
jgi:hypothetical protein